MLPIKSTESENLRLRTPNFNKGQTEGLEELREMFRVLKTEQESLKKKLSSHKNLIRALGSPTKMQERIYSEAKIRLNSNNNVPDTKSHVSQSSRKLKVDRKSVV